jgi:prevent-host-death family protein
MNVSLSEAKTRLNYYVEVAQTQEVIILKHGRRVARLIGEKESRKAAAQALFGLLGDPVDWEAERLGRTTR